jgi:bacillopeptidase F (M6 metalloprotease family)
MRRRTKFIFLALTAVVLCLVGGWVASSLGPETQAIMRGSGSQYERDAKLYEHLSYQMSSGLPITEAEKDLFLELESPFVNERDSRNTLDNQGGPDAFQYVYRDNVAPDNVPYEWIELRDDGDATWIGGLTHFTSVDDGSSRQKLPIGFPFPFYGTNYDCVRVATNGFLQFGAVASTSLSNACFPSTGINGPAIAAFWDDLHLLRGGRPDTIVVGYKNFGTHFVIEYDHVGYYATACTTGTWLTFETILYPNGDIKLQYNNITPPTSCINSQSIGIQDTGATGSAALNYVCNTTGIQPVNGLAILFARATGIPNPCTNVTGSYVAPNVVINWTDPTTDTQGNNITVQNVEVWLGAAGTGTLLGTVNPGVQTYTHLNAPTGSNIYAVRPYLSPYYGAVVSVPVIVGSPGYANDFETTNGGWVADPPTGGWVWGTPTLPTTLLPHSGTKVWGTVLTANYAASACYKLTLSPGLAVTSPTATVEFWRWWDTEQAFDGVNFKVSTDQGATWTLVQPTGNYPYTSSTATICIPSEPYWAGHTGGTWTQIVIPIGQFVGQVPSFRFTFGSDGSVQYPGFFFDDLIIWGVGNQNGIPNPCTNLTGAYTSPNVVLNWLNPTQDTQGNAMTVDSVQVWMGAAGTGTLLSTLIGNLQTYTQLNAPIGIRTYTVRPANDGFFGQPLSTVLTVGNPGYVNTFETNNGNWVASPETGGWSWGTPTNTTAPAPYSGTGYWGTGLTANYPASACWKVDLDEGLVVTGAEAYVEFMYRFDSELTYDGCNFKVSTDDGVSWTIMTPSEGAYNITAASTANTCMGGQPMWGGHVNTAWAHAAIPIGQFIGQIVNFRFEFSSDPSVSGYMGFFFDDFVVWGASVQSGIPQPCTNFSAAYSAPNVVLNWTNPTLDTQGNPVTLDSVQIWIGSTASGTHVASVAGSVHTYTHNSAPSGTYYYTIRPYHTPYFGAPTTSSSVTVGSPSFTFDFETDGGGWVSSGGGAIWQWGAPTVGTGGPAPHGGANCWGTVLAGTYTASACEYLDLNLGMPVTSPAASVNFWYWVDGESSYDGANFKVSTDGGSTWTLITPQTGYTVASFFTANLCTPSQAGWGGRDSTWREATMPIGQFMGQTPIFRFTFGSDPSVQYRGFFFDDMVIWGLRPVSTVTGTVRSYGNNQAIADALVWAVGQPDTAVTDNNGTYILAVEAGTYSVTFDHPHFCDTTYNNVVVEIGSETIRNAVMRAPHGQVSVNSMEIETGPGTAVQDTFQITNVSGQCPLDFSVADTSTWLSVTPPSGTVIPNQTANIIVHVNPTGMAVGDYSSTLIVTHNSTGSPSPVRINLHIADAADNSEPIPTEFAYYQNYPNPFNAQTALRFDVPQLSRVRITVYNIIGQEVAHPVDDVYSPGRYRVLYDASALPSGMYLVKMSSASYEKIGKMMLIK